MEDWRWQAKFQGYLLQIYGGLSRWLISVQPIFNPWIHFSPILQISVQLGGRRPESFFEDKRRSWSLTLHQPSALIHRFSQSILRLIAMNSVNYMVKHLPLFRWTNHTKGHSRMQKGFSFSRRNEIRIVRDSSSLGFKPCEFRSSTTGKKVLRSWERFSRLKKKSVRYIHRKSASGTKWRTGWSFCAKEKLRSRKKLTMSSFNLLRSRLT